MQTVSQMPGKAYCARKPASRDQPCKTLAWVYKLVEPSVPIWGSQIWQRHAGEGPAA